MVGVFLLASLNTTFCIGGNVVFFYFGDFGEVASNHNRKLKMSLNK